MYTISGYRKISYTNKQDRKIEGVEFHLINADSELDSSFNGTSVLVQFVSTDKISGTLSVGGLAELHFAIRNGQPVLSGISIS